MDSRSIVSGASLTPSDLARSRYFESWAAGAGLLHRRVPREPTVSAFKALTDFKLPKHFTTTHNYHQNGEKDFYESLREWGSNNQTLVEETDVHKLKNVSHVLYSAYWAITTAVNDKACELAQRRGVDSIIQLAFSGRLGADHRVWFKQDIQMCQSSWEAISVGAKATADTVVVTPISEGKMDDIIDALIKVTTRLEVRRRLFWTSNITRQNSLIIFLGEFKKDEGTRNQNQLLFDFLTAQSQRLALGLPDVVIWGSTCAMGKFTVYSSKWNEDNTIVRWSSHCTWDLTVPIDFLRCYAFLCMLSDGLKGVRNDINALDASEVAQQCENTPWCATTMPPPRTSNKRRRGDDGQPTAGPSSGRPVEESEYVDLEVSIDGSGGDIGTESAESDVEAKRGKGKLVPSEGHTGVVYDKLHGLTPDTDWWRSYLV